MDNVTFLAIGLVLYFAVLTWLLFRAARPGN